MANKIAEKLLILTEVAKGVLIRLGQTKKVFSSPQKPVFVSDVGFQKLTAAMIKKFPEFDATIEKTPGYDLLVTKAKGLFEELEPYYFSFVDAFEFKEAGLLALNEIGSQIGEMKFEDCPTLLTHFMNLLVKYVEINSLLASIEERKIILAYYYKLFFYIKCVSEPNFGRLANYIIAFEQPMKAMQEEFRPMTQCLGKTVANLMQIYMKLRTVSQLRKEGTLSLTLKPEEMAKPITDKFHFSMIQSENITLWIVYGLLVCPEAFAVAGTTDLCKLALSEGFVFTSHAQNAIPIHVEYDNLFTNYKNKALDLKKNKKVIKEATNDAFAKGGVRHKERRTYLRQDLNSLRLILNDSPQLIAPKIQMLLCALSLAKEEIFWYFRHCKPANSAKTLGRKIVDEEYKDNRISELIFVVDAVHSLIKKYKKSVQEYYVEYLCGADSVKLADIINNPSLPPLVGPQVMNICQSILEEIKHVSLDQFHGGKQYDFKALRLNWFRVESFLSSLQSPCPPIRCRELLDRLLLIYNHTRFVDDLDGLLEEFGSLKALWYWRDYLLEIFEEMIKDGPNQPLHVAAFLRLFQTFPSNATAHNPEERAEIGTAIVADVEKMIGSVCKRLLDLINEVARNYISFNSQLQDVNAAYPLLMKQKDFKPSKDMAPPPIAGMESHFRQRHQTTIERLRLY